MGSVVSNIANIQQQFMNNIPQQYQQNCISNISHQGSLDNVTLVNGVNINGDVVGNAKIISTDASCLITSNIQDSVSDILSSLINQTNKSETDWYNGFNFDSEIKSFDIGQSIVNNISQINQNICSANTIVSTSDNFNYITNDRNDFVGVVDSSSSAACSVDNFMKNYTYNQLQANPNNNNTIRAMFVMVLTVFLIIIGIIIVGVVFLFPVGALHYVGYETTNSYPV